MKKLVIGMVCLVCAGGAGSVYGDPVQWAGNGHWYDAVLAGPQGITWENADNAAIARGGYLASITSASEDDFAYSLIAGNDAFWFTDDGGNGIGPWLGGYQFNELAEPSGNWTWTSGESWSYTNWMPFEPTNGAGHTQPPVAEDYLQFAGWQTSKAATWNDYRDTGWPQTDGSQGLPRGYIIEFNTNPAPEPASLSLLVGGAASLLIRRRK